jgi:hypothetical protein
MGKKQCQDLKIKPIKAQDLLIKTGENSMRYAYKLLIIAFIIAFTSKAVLAIEKSLEIVFDNTEITLSSSIRMDLVFYDSEDIPAPNIPDIQGLNISYLRSTDVISRIDGKTQKGKRHTYLIMPERVGVFEIGPINVSYGNIIYKSKQTEIRVISGLSRPAGYTADVIKEEEFRAKENVFLIATPERERVYVNELFQLTVALYYKDIQLTDIEYPVLEHEGFLMGEFTLPQASRKDVKGYNYRIITFRNNIFALRPGDLKLGPAKVSCNVLTSDSTRPAGMMESGAQRKSSLQPESSVRNITVLPLPQRERPGSFKGAVGDFDLSFDAKPEGYIETGQAIVLTMELSGKGNFKMVDAPAIEESEGFIFYSPTIESESDTSRVFKQILVPKTTLVTEIPEIEFSFFNPDTEKYVTIKKGPLEIKVFDTVTEKPQLIIEAPDRMIPRKVEEELIGEGIIYIKERSEKFRTKGAYLYNNKGFMAFQAVPIVLYFFTVFFYKRYKRFKEDISYARAKIAEKKARKGLRDAQSALNSEDIEMFYSSILECVQEYLGNKFNLPPGGITSDIADNILKSKNFDIAAIEAVKNFFSDCYLARFTPHRYEKKDMINTFCQAKKLVEYFKRI